MIESRFWEVIGEPRGDYSRLRDQAPRKHDFAWWKCSKWSLKETLFSRAKGASAQSTVDGSAELSISATSVFFQFGSCFLSAGAEVCRGVGWNNCPVSISLSTNFGKGTL